MLTGAGSIDVELDDEPQLLAEPPDLSELRDGQVWPVAEVRRLINRTWREARLQFRARLERDVAKARTRLEADYQAKRDELVAEVVKTTTALIKGE